LVELADDPLRRAARQEDGEPGWRTRHNADPSPYKSALLSDEDLSGTSFVGIKKIGQEHWPDLARPRIVPVRLDVICAAMAFFAGETDGFEGNTDGFETD
jgi:hypothetical protein